ncbi:MAG: amino acid adenylation domain-containing protein, partial [Archangium sp.]
MSEALSSEAAIGFRLSPQQESLWIRQAGGAVPTVQARILLEGVWEHTALERALLRLEERHENLRTTFIQVPGIPLPLQSMGEPGGLALHRVSLGVEHVEPRGEALERLAREERQRPFTLARGPLARACLVTGAPGRAVLLLTVPALCADCASMATLVRELAGLLAGEELPEAPPQYADVSEWLHEQKASEEAATASRRWEERELRALKAQRLPVEPATQEEQAGGEPVRTLLGGERLAGLRRTAERLGVGLDALLLGCWHALLWRLGGQEESVCGVVPASRGYEELDATVGLFARPVPISSPTTGGTRFPALVEKLAAALAALAEQQYLFHMARPLPEASPGRAFPITFSFFELPEALAAQGLTLSLRVLESGAEHTPLALDCVATGDGLELTLGAALPQYARQLSEQFLSVLDTVVESPDVTLDELGLARGAERERLLRTFNETRAEPPAVQLVHALFESHALRKPEALAVFVEGQRLTYGELDARANQLAHLLVERGVGPDVPVALCLERSLDFILALLGVLKAGGAYVPMDPGFPEARIQQILEDARPALVLTHRGLLSAAHVPCPVHALEELGPTLDSKPRRRPDVTCHPENLTYLIYTSGSTGRPKGVGISHRALCHYVTSVERRLQLEPDAVLGTLATVAADLGNTSLFGALCTGRGLWLCALDDVLSPAELARRFAEQPVDCLKIVPSHLSALLASPEAEQLLPRHCLVLGGEELTGTLVARIRALRPQLRILNHYGPTETTVGALTREVPPGTGASSEGLPIGWPMDHYRAYVLDARMRPVIQGAEGELYIGGAGVARGYWNRPELTAERFLADPFSTEPGAIVYRTGDRVRQRRDGAIEFLGRMDHQVKLRGNRIELGEIEAGLRQHVHVADVVVVVREERPGDKFLAAYVVPKPGERLEAAELREHLRSRLPAFMVPAAFALLDALPLTPNGKVDRKALPHPDLKDSRRVYTPPRDELEAALLGFWEELLHCERAGIHDNFFELGGDSLLATRLMARIRTTQGVRLEVRTLFEAPTVARLAERITRERQAQGTRQMPQGPALVRVPRSGPLPLSFAQRRLWILSEIDGASAAYNIPAALRLRGALDVDALVRALQEIVRRHEALRTNFLRVGEEPVQVIAEGYTLHVPVEESREEDIVPRARAHATRPFDLATEPLFRATLLRLSPEEHVLLVCLHHIVSDGWSTGVLIRELVALYGAFREGRASPLSELPLQYADFASWQMEWLTGGELERQLAYWKKQLQGLPDLLELPSDRPRPPTQSYRGAVLPFELPEPLTERLRALSRQHEATLFITLLAAFQTLLARYTGQTDIAVGSPIAHRTHGELEGLIGCFFNTLVLRGDLSGAPDFTTLLARVKETTLAAHAHQDVPFERLVEVLQPRRSLSHSPLFQVMFILQNVPTGRLELPGLELRPVEFEMPVSKFDLTLDLTDTPQGLRGRLEYSTDLFDASTMERLSRHLRVLLEAIATDPARSVFELPLLEPREAHQQLVEWNATDLPYPREHLMPDAFEAQARRTPEATAVVLEEGLLTYGELEARSNRLAHRLRSLGVGPESRVGVCVERSLELVVSLLAVLKAGGAYIPLDPSFPTERLAYMARDGGIRVLLTQVRLEEHVPAPGVPRVRVDRPEDVASFPAEPPARALSGSNLAYVLYTSGSTGQPKGVMVEHGNVAAFFAAMDERLGREPGTWLAITSISFDISLLELLWTLTRGFKVVLFGENTAPVSSQPRASVRPLDFSLFYFASDAGEHGRDKYRLLLEGAKFADAHGFSAVWTPERHFGTFGGLYPNPAVTGAAIASITRNVGIRSGSCVLPLRDPINVAEDWSVIDNLSNGRVGLSFASGWQPTDFVFAPEKYRDRKEAMFQGLETVRRLWRGEAVKRRAGDGREVDVRTLPRPVQAELPVWITAAGNPETFRRAGKVGARLLTHLLGQSLEELEKSIALYREAWRKHGHGPGGGHVSLMLHTFVCDDDARARDLVKEPLKNYLRESVDLVRPLAAARGLDVENFSAEDLEALLDHAFQRYFETSGLFGTPERCAPLVEALKRVGVDEVACLIDFGLEADTVLAHLLHLRELKDRSQPQAGAPRDYSIPALIERHGVTHFQCTPSMAGLLVADEGAREALGRLRYMLVGGEALPVKLARELTSLVTGQVLNMYGPTETTVWSTTHRVEGGAVSIGRPIANTRVYVLDGHGQPAPVGVPGELYIGGEGVARGYLGRPELTRERFVENVLRDVPGQRLYRTGDLVRYRPDGTLDFLGRRDHQIKLNGFRIEVGEIEAVLASHAAVREAVVAPREEPSGTRRLVA